MLITGLVAGAALFYLYYYEPAREARAPSTRKPASADARGELGEALVSVALHRHLTRLCGGDYRVLDGVVLVHAPGTAFPTAEVDHLVIAPFGVFVIETKHWAGAVARGADDDTLVLATPDGQRLTRTSPMKQNAAKVRFVRSLLPPRLWTVEGIGVFSHAAARLDPGLPAALLEAGELYRHLRVRQQQFARTGTGPLPVSAIAGRILGHADLRPQALAEHRARIEAARGVDVPC
jgi:hypothetical protein